MKILLVHYGKLEKYPPVISLIQNLINNNHVVTLITEGLSILSVDILKNDNFIGIDIAIKYPKNIFARIYNMISRKNSLRKLIESEMVENELIWTTTDKTAREIGKSVLLKYKHVMQLMELIEDIPLFSNQSLFKAHLNKIAKNAFKIVVPEENRAYIQKTWWNLDKVPCILPNKPYTNSEFEIADDTDEITRELRNEKRTIILYQGIFETDRNLEEFAKAIQELGVDKYAFYMIGKDSSQRKELCEKYPFIKYLGFITPPKHLQITKLADIGLLPYVPDKTNYYCSELNALYCAPNKIYEYALCGLPMLGTDVLGLKIPFEKYGIGICCKKLEKIEIIKAIQYVELHHKEMSINCKNFYTSINLDQIVNDILYRE